MQHLVGALESEEVRAGVELVDLDDAELDGGHDAEVPAAAAQCPEQLGLVLGVDADQLAAAHEDGEPQIRSRLRTRRGVWLLMHGAVLEGTGQVALIIEPAKSADVAPLIVEAYGLTGRELEVTRAIARGLSTTEIAAELYLSPHTVRDHVKALFEKVGVSSRGELVHRVFAEHYAAPSHPLS